MNRYRSAAVLVLAVLSTLALAGPAAAQHQVPFHGVFEGDYTVTPIPGTPTATLVVTGLNAVSVETSAPGTYFCVAGFDHGYLGIQELGNGRTLVIFSVDGRRVKSLVSGVREAGEYRETWDGRSDDGLPVGNGIYYARLITAQGKFSRKLVHLH